MKPEDSVDLAIYTTMGYPMWLAGLSRDAASTVIESWIRFKELVQGGNEEAAKILECGTASNSFEVDGRKRQHTAFAWKGVIAMQIVERMVDKVVSTQERLLDLLEGEARRGEEWRDGEGEELP